MISRRSLPAPRGRANLNPVKHLPLSLLLAACSSAPGPVVPETAVQGKMIGLLEKFTKIVNVDAGIDYRLRALQQAALYHFPLNDAAAQSLEDSFSRLASTSGKHWERLEINRRYLTCRRVAKDVAWFDFAELCAGPRSQNDYIELARIFQSVLISGVPRFLPDMDDQARRFVNLVDEFYDRNVKLVLTAEVPLLELYGGGGLTLEFQRTISRLQEMQSYEYLAREHLP